MYNLAADFNIWKAGDIILCTVISSFVQTNSSWNATINIELIHSYDHVYLIHIV